MVGEVWTLRRGAELLGEIHVTGSREMFWLSGAWYPTSAFEDVRPLFDEAERCSDEERFLDLDDVLARIQGAGVTLNRPDGVPVKDWLLWLDGTGAAFSWSEDP